MPLKAIPSTGQLNWGTPLNDHLSQLNDPATGGINTAPLLNPTPDDEGYTYLDIDSQKLYRLDSTLTNQEVLSTSIPIAISLNELKTLLQHHDYVYYDSNHWQKVSGDYSQIELDDTEDGYIVAIDNTPTTIAVGIRQTNYVSYDMFKADNTGATSADDALVAAHKVSNYFKLPVIQHTGTYLWGYTPIEIGPVPYIDLTGVTILFDSNSGLVPAGYNFNYMYDILPETPVRELTPSELSDLNQNYANELVKNGANLSMPLFHEYREAMIRFNSPTIEFIRSSGTQLNIEDSVITGLNGVLSVPFSRNLDANIDRVDIIPKSSFRLRFYCPKVIFTTDDVPSTGIIRCYRSQTDIFNLDVQETTPPNVAAIRTFIKVASCYDVSIQNCQLVAQRNTNNVPTINEGGGSYGINLQHALRIYIHNLTGHDGWGIMGNNYMKEVTIENSSINRVDAHWTGHNTIVRNCLIKNIGIVFSGNGRLVIENVRFLVNEPGDYADNIRGTLFSPRSDYGYYFDGELILRNITIEISPTFSGNEISLVQLGGLGFDSGADSYLPKSIIAENIHFVLPDNKTQDLSNPFKCHIFNLSDVRTVNEAVTEDYTLYAPDYIKAESVYVSSKNSGWIINGIWVERINQGKVLLRNSNYTYSENGANCQVILRDIQQSRLPIVTENTGGVVNIMLDPNQDSATYTNSDRAWKPYVLVDNCINASIHFVAKGYVKVINSSVSTVDRFNFITSQDYSYPDNQTSITINNSNIKPVLAHQSNNVYRIQPHIVTNCLLGYVQDHGGNNMVIDLNNIEGYHNRLDQDTVSTDFSNIPDGFFKESDTQIVDANGSNNTATINTILDSLRNQGIIDR